VFDQVEALKPGAPQLYDEYPGNFVPKYKPEVHGYEVVIGDVKKGFGEADYVVEHTFAVENRQNPLPPEPAGTIAEWNNGKLTIWGSIQQIGLIEMLMRMTLKLRPGHVRVIACDVGAGYGSKATIIGPNLYAPALAQAARQPVAVLQTREEQFATHNARMGSRARYKIGIKKDGTVTAIEGEQIANGGAIGCLQSQMLAVGLIAIPILAKCQNVNFTTNQARTNVLTAGPYRGFGYLEHTSLLSAALHVAMEKIDIDPVEYFKKNVIEEGDKYVHCYEKLKVSTSAAPSFAPAIQKGAELFRWSERWKGWGKPSMVDGDKWRGVGVGISGESDVGEQSSNKIVQLNPFGEVTVYHGGTEFGTGTIDVMKRMVCESLQVPLDRVHMSDSDSTVGPWEWGSTGSRSTYAMGTATLAAAEDAKKKLLERASKMIHVPVEELETRDGMIFTKGAPPGKALPWIAVMGWQGVIIGEGHYPGRFNLPTHQGHFVEVEVDTGTGLAKVIDLFTFTDAGQIIDPLMLKGQLQGFNAGIGLALFEETVFDRATGRVLNPNMIDYKTTVFPDLPTHNYTILETPITKADPPCPYNARGCGEMSLAPAGPAIIMAIYNAIGKRFNEYPITPDKILRALGKVKGGAA
jgi:xanthine dehydrogenase molybdenum-binding subunit